MTRRGVPPRALATLGAGLLALTVAMSGCSAGAGVPVRAGDTVSADSGGGTDGRPAIPTPDSVAPTAAADAAERGALSSNQDPAGPAGPSLAHQGITPVRVRIDAIGVDSELEGLSRDAAGWIQPPKNFASAGWYQEGVVPGDVGPAVIAGHIDNAVGPAVFFGLSSLNAGDRVIVILSDGSMRMFAVDRQIVVAKAAFPTGEVYAPTPTAQLRLITCGGVFDDATGHYVDNVVVFASEVPVG
ncbi:class F sortase [Subtercola sp. Z020]|uniref:class F sortase n=1 Tax=Subtercola sp. Z020 TaxID=2080582 RepID=UPI000CE83F80|nr:class F sortase [Subtercola sp. Z020]PPF85671.1 class F sortase [Subtercola sp. Z020]